MTVRSCALASAGLALGVAGVHVSPTLALTPQGRRLFPVLTRVDGAPDVALTFDDGPDRSTEIFLEILQRANATATFFVVGEQVEMFPSLVQEMVAAGHEIGVHGYTHRHPLLQMPRQVHDDLARAKYTIERAIDRQTTLYRPPHGIFSLASWLETGGLGWRRVLWSRWGKDWRADATPDSIMQLVGKPDGGDIVLLHDSDRYAVPGSWRRTVIALPRIIELIKEQGLQAKSISSLLGAASA